MIAMSTLIFSALRITEARPMASSPTRQPLKPPPITSRSMSFQPFSLRKRRVTRANSWAKDFDRALDDARRFGVATGQQRIEVLLGEHAARLVAERVVADLAQRLAPAFDEFAERALAGAVADEALVILEFDVVSLDLDRGQRRAAVPGECRSDECLISHAEIAREIAPAR